MADLSFEAQHLLKTMQSSGENRKTPLRNEKELGAMQELEMAGLVEWHGWPNGSIYSLTLRGSTYRLTKP